MFNIVYYRPEGYDTAGSDGGTKIACSNMSEAMAEYYSELMDDRYSLFEDKIDLEHIDMYSKNDTL